MAGAEDYYRQMGRREWGTGSCFKVGPRTYRVAISLGSDAFGKRRRKAWEFSGATEARAEERAKAKLREVQRRLDRGLPPEDSRMTLGAYVPQWLSAVEHTVRPATFAQYRSLAEIHLEELEAFKLPRITAQDIRDLLSARLREGYATRTVRGILDVLRMILRQASEDGHVERNVAEYVKGPRLQQAEPQHFSVEQARRFLEVAKDDKLYSLYAVALGTGLRRGELLALTWRDVDSSPPHVVVRRGKTAAAARRVPLPPFAEMALAGERRAPGPIWQVTPWWVTRRFGQLCERAGLPKMPLHSTRHTAASLMYAEGVPDFTVKSILGHTKVSMTQRYTHVEDEQRREAIDKLGRAIGE